MIIQIFLFTVMFFKHNYKGFKYLFTVEGDKELKLLKVNEKIPNINNVNYYRDIPCQNDIIRLHWFLYQYNMIENEMDIIGAFLLFWAKHGKIDIIVENGKKKIDFKNLENADSKAEETLVRILKLFAGKDKILEERELVNWCKKNHRELDVWFKQVIRQQTEIFEKEGKIYESKAGKVMEENLNEEAIKILGLKKYLLDYSLICEKEPIEVTLWEEYLIFAQAMGIAYKVQEQFAKIYPEIQEIQKYNFKYISKTGWGRAFRILIYMSCTFNGFLFMILFQLGMLVLSGILYIITNL